MPSPWLPGVLHTTSFLKLGGHGRPNLNLRCKFALLQVAVMSLNQKRIHFTFRQLFKILYSPVRASPTQSPGRDHISHVIPIPYRLLSAAEAVVTVPAARNKRNERTNISAMFPSHLHTDRLHPILSAAVFLLRIAPVTLRWQQPASKAKGTPLSLCHH